MNRRNPELIPIVSRNIIRCQTGKKVEGTDQLLEEAPLEIVISNDHDKEKTIPLSLTMRTPGSDEWLVIGFLHTEGIIQHTSDIEKIELRPPSSGDDSRLSQAIVHLSESANFRPEQLQRNFYTASSCGICGKPGMDQVCQDFHYLLPPSLPQINLSKIPDLSKSLDIPNSLFSTSGGAHTALLLNHELQLIDYQEDVGRHNALDKVIGKALSQDSLPLNKHVLVLSGRIGFELVQKALRAGIAIIVAKGAASDGAVRLAETQGMTLAGFLKSNKLNIYCGAQRFI
jgi:FdhD protein